MSDQLQCPNCGGYKINDHAYAIDPETGKTWDNAQIEENSSSMVQAFIFAWLLPFLIYAIYLVVQNKRGRQVLAEQPIIHDYTCLICNFQWKWREDQPYKPPEVTSTHDQDDLLHMGAQRLEEEEAAALRAATAAYGAERERLRREREGH